MSIAAFSRTLLIAAAACMAVSGATYHFASDGDDNRTAAQAGSPQTPWQTITKLNSLTLQAGDSVLFRCRDVMRGGIVVRQSGASGNEIHFGSFGTGVKPVISGAVAITGTWTLSQNGIYVTEYAGDPTRRIEQVFASTVPLPIARHPDEGYLTIDSAVDQSTFFSSALIGAVDWTGASIHLKTERWTLDWRVIAAHDRTTGKITLNRAANYDIKKGWGFFINASLAALDRAGEWYYDSTAHRLYVKPSTGTSLTGIDASVTDCGIDLAGRSWVTVENLRFFGHVNAAVRCNGAANLTIRACDADYVDGVGMELGCAGSRVQSCGIRYANVKGLGLNGQGNTLADNSLIGVGMLWRLNRRGFGGGCCTGRGIDFGGGTNTVTGNTLDSIGYIGIGFSGINNLIERNYVNHVCLTTDDGAAIYTWSDAFASPGAAGTIIRKNVVMNGVGAPQGAGASGGWAHGIYMDDRTHDIRIDSNTTYNNELGIFLHNNRRHIVTGNVCYGNRNAQIQIQRDAIVDSTVYGNQVFGNVFFSTDNSQACVKQEYYQANDSVLAHLRDNIECNETRFGIECVRDGALVWSQKYFDAQTLVRGGNKIVNGDFDSAALAWGCWPSEFFTLTVDQSASPDGKCLRMRYSGDPQTRGPLVQASRAYSLVKDAVYWLRFSAKENHPGTISVIARMAHDPWTAVGLSRSVALDTGWRDFEFFFSATLSDTNCRVDFQQSRADSLVWIDNVSLFQIDASGIPTEIRSKLFYNLQSASASYNLGSDTWRQVDGTRGVRGSITLGSLLSRVLVRDSIGVVGALPITGHRPAALSIRRTSRGFAVGLEARAGTRVAFQLMDMRGRVVSAAERVGVGENCVVSWQPEVRGLGRGLYVVKVRAAGRVISRSVVVD